MYLFMCHIFSVSVWHSRLKLVALLIPSGTDYRWEVINRLTDPLTMITVTSTCSSTIKSGIAGANSNQTY